MAKHAHGESAPPRLVRVASSVLAWHDARPRASMSSPRGWIWAALVAAVFFWMSNPLVFVPGFQLALPLAMRWTLIALVVTLPWLRVPRVPWPWLAFLALCWLSTSWSIYPVATQNATVIYAKITLIAMLIAANCSVRVVAWGLAAGGALVMALSLYAFHEQMWGAAFISVDGPVLTGVGTNQNILAYTIAISLAATLALALPEKTWAKAVWAALLGFQYYAIYRAGSGTGYLTALCVTLLVGAVVLAPVVRRLSRGHAWGGATALGLAVLAAGTGVLALLGDQLSTVSGRVPFWGAIIEVSMQRPFLGAGWGAVWSHPWYLIPPNAVVEDIIARADGYALSHGHNMFLDILPDLGVSGILVTLAMILYAVRAATRSGLGGGVAHTGGRLIVLVLLALMMFGLTEPLLSAPVGWWSLALVVGVVVQRETARDSHGGPVTPDRGLAEPGRGAAAPSTAPEKAMLPDSADS